MSLSLDDLKELVKMIAKEQAVSQPSESSESRVSHVLSCPECNRELLKKLTELAKNKTLLQCRDCGSLVKTEWDACPTCGGKRGRNIDV